MLFFMVCLDNEGLVDLRLPTFEKIKYYKQLIELESTMLLFQISLA